MERVVLFAKTPRRGAVKTRLVPPLTEEQALALHEAMLSDQIDFVRSLGRSAELCLDEPWPDAPGGLETTLQGDGDLGRRMLRALARGPGPTAILGADAPTLPRSLVEEAFLRLRDGAEVAITPAQDGGYVLIATTTPLPELFREIPWGSERVLAVTRERARASGIALAETDGWYDVDRIDDLPRLPSETERAPRTARLVAALRLYLPERPVL